MEAATSNLQHSFGLSHRGPNLNMKPVSEQAASGLPRPEEQHHKPFFYVQPSQSYLPMQSLQWPGAMPLPMSYNPYYGYPGLGFGMPIFPHYQPNPYLEPPGFVVPHTHLHLMDYRRILNPQYYHTMAYHSRRFRYQQNSTSKEMTSSEVQTEPLLSGHRTSTPRSSECSTKSPTVATGQVQSPALTVQTVDQEKAPSSATGMPSNSSFLIQTEEVRIECCTTPVGLQLLRTHDVSEMPHSFSQDMLHCGSPTAGGFQANLPADQSKLEVSVCPDILLVGKPNSGEKSLSLEEQTNRMDPVTENQAQETPTDDSSVTSKGFHYKAVHVPFDSTYLDELRKMESTVWSAEETFMTSPVQNTLIKALNKTLNASPEANAMEMLTKEIPAEEINFVTLNASPEAYAIEMMLTTEIPAEEITSVTEIHPLADVEQEEKIPTVENSEANICHMTDASSLPELKTAEVTLSANILLLDSPPLDSDREHQLLETTNDQDHHDTSFESLPAYLPSTSWFSDFDHSYYRRKMPQAFIKQNRPRNVHGLEESKRRRKLDIDYEEQPTIRKPKKGYKPKANVDRQSFSDHECCLSRNFNENMLTSRRSKNERLCTRCTEKHRISKSSSSICEGRSLKRKAVPFQQWNNVLLTCEACKTHTKRQLMMKGSNQNLCSPHYGHETEGEHSGNGSSQMVSKWRVADNSRKLQDIKKPLTSRQMVTKSPMGTHTMLRQSNCVHNDQRNQSVGWERLRQCPHGNAIQEIDENCDVPVSVEAERRNLDQIYLMHRRQNVERTWRDATLNTYNGRFLKEAISQHLINHKKTQPQSQGICTKETRC